MKACGQSEGKIRAGKVNQLSAEVKQGVKARQLSCRGTRGAHIQGQARARIPQSQLGNIIHQSSAIIRYQPSFVISHHSSSAINLPSSVINARRLVRVAKVEAGRGLHALAAVLPVAPALELGELVKSDRPRAPAGGLRSLRTVASVNQQPAVNRLPVNRLRTANSLLLVLRTPSKSAARRQ